MKEQQILGLLWYDPIECRGITAVKTLSVVFVTPYFKL